jgi:gliding motility-associated-like protein
MALAIFPLLPSAEQSQSCPINSDFSTGTLLHWEAYTGNNMGGNGPTAIKLLYDSGVSAPSGTIGATAIPEYQLPGVNGIRVITSPGVDPFGGFPTIPTINGYAYQYAILLGSTSVANRQPGNSNPAPGQPPLQNTGEQGGYVRGISYHINVPPGPTSVAYTMTYAYAMVLENGTHASLDQPMARAIISTPGGVISCASPAYFLPTSGSSLDSATARANGFTPSPVPSPNTSRSLTSDSGQHLQDLWTKGWTEVTFDLSAYRGQQVTLTFEADNCVPGGHFAYAYFALRDRCAGLQMSGDTIACANATAKFYIPSLDSATYNWSVPPGWTIDPGSTGNNLAVTVGPRPGYVVARETNSCTSLTDSLFVKLYPGALPQSTFQPHDSTVCYGNGVPLHALITAGTQYTWQNPAPVPGTATGPIPTVPFNLDVTAAPAQTTDYILSLLNAGCPISVSDTFRVTVVQPIRVEPGNDTIVVLDEPLRFHATTSDPYPDVYQWTPATNLSNPDIADPIGQYGTDIDTITYTLFAIDTFGCSGTGTVKVTVAHTLPDIFVPNAFTPGAASNNLFRPICLGVSSLEFFRVFNRWGQLMFSTSRIGQGWDGRIQGKLQETNTFLWVLKGTDYTGKPISKRGTVMLIR